jgi:hypothetical protein
MLKDPAEEAAATVIAKFAVADCGAVEVESVTVIATGAVPTEFCAGVPVMVPVEASIDSPPGRPLAL